MPLRRKPWNLDWALDYNLMDFKLRRHLEFGIWNLSFTKTLSLLSLVFFAMSCNSDNAPDCFKNSGALRRIEVEVAEFENITVFENLNLVLKQGAEQKVELESGEFLLEGLTAEVTDNRLILRNENGCNLLREYALSTVYVTSPNIREVRSSTGLLVSSDGVLNYPNLNLVSESFNEPEAATTSGTFDLDLNVQSVRIVVNGIAYFKLRGVAQNLFVSIPAGDTRVEAEGLMAQTVRINHRGSNDILVNPQESISGIIRGYGNVISSNRPTEIDVEETFEGRLIFTN